MTTKIIPTTFETYCPLFEGFYNTVFQYDSEEYDIESYNEENGTDLSFNDFTFDYREYEERIGRAFVNKLESELKDFLPITLEYQKINSPKFYNFSNDSIDIKASFDLLQLIDLLKSEERKEQAAKYIKEKYTSYSGFISFHSNDINDWLNVDYIMESPAHRIGGLLDVLCSIEIDRDDTMYWGEGENYIDFWPNEVNV